MAVTSFGSASAGLQQYEKIFTSSGTWTKPAGVKTCEVTVVGGGGTYGAGGYVKKIVDVSNSSSVPVVVAAPGGTSSFGTLNAGTSPNTFDQGGWYDTSVSGTGFFSSQQLVGTPFGTQNAQPGDVAYGNGVYVAITNGSQYSATSTDGSTWTVANTGSANSLWWYSADQTNYGGLLFWEGKFRYAYNNLLYSSVDGVTWTNVATPTSGAFNEQPIMRLANGKLFLLGREPGGANAVAYTTTDGVNWTQVYKEVGVNGYNGFKNIAYANGVYLLAKHSSLWNQTYYSTNLTTWTQTSSLNSNITGTVWGDGNYFMFVATNSWSIYYSTNGTSWSSFQHPEYVDTSQTSNPWLMSSQYGGFMLGGNATYNAWIITSPTSWQKFSTPHWSTQWYASGTSNGKYYMFSGHTSNYGVTMTGYQGKAGNKGYAPNSAGAGAGSGPKNFSGYWWGGDGIEGMCVGRAGNWGFETGNGSAVSSGLVRVRWWA